MRRFATAIVFGAVAAYASMAPESVLAATAAAKGSTPSDRVVVMYFHRTQRCPTCLKMGSYSEEAVKKGFARDIKAGTVEFHFIDFEDQNNEALTKGYEISGPTLVVAQVRDNKVKDRKNLTEMWTKSRDKAAFLEYVQSNVQKYQAK